MFDKVLIPLAYQTTCFKLEEMTWRLTEHEGTRPRPRSRWPDKSNRWDTDKTSKCDWDFIEKSLYLHNDYKMTQKALSIKY